jgi:lysophospholipase L1-like esterase
LPGTGKRVRKRPRRSFLRAVALGLTGVLALCGLTETAAAGLAAPPGSRTVAADRLCAAVRASVPAAAADGSKLSVECGQGPATTAAAAGPGDLTISFDVDGLDRNAVQQMIDRQQGADDSLSDVFLRNVEATRVLLEKNDLTLPGPDLAELEEFDNDLDGRLVSTPTGVAAVVPQAEVQANANWWKGTLGSTIGVLAGLVLGAGCMVWLAPTGPVGLAACEGLGAFVSGFLATMLAAVFKGEEINGEVWSESLGNGIAAAVGAVLWGAWVGPVAKDGRFSSVLLKMAEAIRKAGAWFASWWQPGGAAATIIADRFQWFGLGDRIYQYLLGAARRQGFTRSFSVLPLGDSITYGRGSSTGSGYRGDLLEGLGTAGHTVDFRGSQQSGTLPDPQNEGHSGWRIDQIDSITECTMTQYRPGVVTLHIGTNDMNQNYAVETAPQRLVRLVDRILAASPKTAVLVATLVPSTKPDVGPRVQEYNRQIAPLIRQMGEQGKRVRLVDMGAVTTADLQDQLHPNDSGYRKMADAFHRAIEQAVADGLVEPPADAQAGQGGCAAPTQPVTWQNAGRIAPGVGVGIPRDQVRFADVNGDGRQDYLAVDDEGAVRAYVGSAGPSGTDSFTSWGEIASGVGVPGGRVRFADVNGDRRDDYLVLAENGAVAAWLNTPGDRNRPSWSHLGGEPWYSEGLIAPGVGAPDDQIRFADINGDRRDDYLVLADNGAVRAWLNTPGDAGVPSWSSLGQIASGVGAPGAQVRFADIDADGRDDYLVVADNGAVRAWLNTPGDAGVPSWSSLGQIAAGIEGGSRDMLRLADFSGDGRADYLAVSTDGGVRAWIYGGPDSWAYQGAVLSGPPGSQVRAGRRRRARLVEHARRQRQAVLVRSGRRRSRDRRAR